MHGETHKEGGSSRGSATDGEAYDIDRLLRGTMLCIWFAVEGCHWQSGVWMHALKPSLADGRAPQLLAVDTLEAWVRVHIHFQGEPSSVSCPHSCFSVCLSVWVHISASLYLGGLRSSCNSAL